MVSADKQSIREMLFVHSNKGVKGIVMAFIFVFCVLFGSLLGSIAIRICDDTTTGLKFLQLFSSIGMFLLPPLIGAFLLAHNFKDFLSLRKTSWVVILVTMGAMYFFTPFIDYTTALNENLHLPDNLAWIENWMKSMEDKNTEITQTFLKVNSLGGFILNLFVLALVPAIGEELFFRGLIQKSIEKTTHNIHLAIWSAGILFSAIHLQFYGFFPRLFLGVLFGYLLYYSGSIIVPIVCHFLNNSTIVFLSYFAKQNLSSIEESGNDTTLFSAIFSLIFTIGIVVSLRKYIRNKNEMVEIP